MNMEINKETIINVLDRIEQVNDNPRSVESNNYEEIDNLIQEIRKEFAKAEEKGK